MRNSTAIRGRRAALAMAALLGTAGGCEGSDVWVGQLQEGLDLDVCAGNGTHCGSDVPTETLTTLALRTCESEIQPELVTDFSVDIIEPICPLSDRRSCSADVAEVEVSSEGSSWALSIKTTYGNPSVESVWLSHFDDEGVLLGLIEVASGIPFNGGEVRHEVDLAVDSRGHAFVVVYQVDAGPNADSDFAERAWLSEVDVDTALVRDPIFLAGIGASHIAVPGDGTVVIAANALQNARRGVLAALTTSGERLWSQTNVRTTGQGSYGIGDLATDAEGDAFVLAARGPFPGGGDDNLYGLTRYDRGGNAVWDRTFDVAFGYGHVVPSGEGSVLVNGKPIFGQRGVLWHVLSGGTIDWAYDLGVVDPNAPLVDASTGTIYMTGFDVEAASRWALVAISEDGESCQRYAMTDEVYSPLAVDDQGRLFAFGFNTIVRLRLPEE